jgi:hypothetical protein
MPIGLSLCSRGLMASLRGPLTAHAVPRAYLTLVGVAEARSDTLVLDLRAMTGIDKDGVVAIHFLDQVKRKGGGELLILDDCGYGRLADPYPLSSQVVRSGDIAGSTADTVGAKTTVRGCKLTERT